MANRTVSASIVGGIGDIIFGLEGFREIKENMCGDDAETLCYLCTHASHGGSIVRANPHVDRVKTIEFAKDLSHFNALKEKTRNDVGYLGDAKNFCYTENPNIYLPERALQKAISIRKTIGEERPLVIIHPCGSAFSRYFLGEVRNVSTKEMEVSIWQSIIQELWRLFNPHIILLGSKKDHPVLSAIKGNSPDVQILAGDLSIVEAMALVQKSHTVIGADSFAKSVSLANQIPTVVLVPDHEDHFRDEVFLSPYENEEYACIIHGANSMQKSALMSKITTFIKDLWGLE